MSNFNILVIEDQEGLDSKSTSYRVAQTTSSDDKTNSKKVTKMRKILNAIGLREIVWVIILVIVVITTAISVNKLNKKVENLTKFMAYERINDLGYFQKLSEKMTYADGQIECSKIFGHIVEFKWDGSKCGFIFKCKYFSSVHPGPDHVQLTIRPKELLWH